MRVVLWMWRTDTGWGGLPVASRASVPAYTHFMSRYYRVHTERDTRDAAASAGHVARASVQHL